MLKDLGKYIFMIELGFHYIAIFKKTFFHPFITYKEAYKQLSIDRQHYSNKVLDFLNIEVEAVGSLPQRNKILYAINHRSLLDILVMENVFSKFQKSGVWIAKQELLDSPLYGKFFEYSGCMSVDINHKKGLMKFFKKMKEILVKTEDLNVYIFPEGERNKEFCIKGFQSGAYKIAKANNLDVVPVFIDAELEKVYKASPFENTKCVRVIIGEPVGADELESSYKALLKKANKDACL